MQLSQRPAGFPAVARLQQLVCACVQPIHDIRPAGLQQAVASPAGARPAGLGDVQQPGDFAAARGPPRPLRVVGVLVGRKVPQHRQVGGERRRVLHGHVGDHIIRRLVRAAAPVPDCLRRQVLQSGHRQPLADAAQVPARPRRAGTQRSGHDLDQHRRVAGDQLGDRPLGDRPRGQRVKEPLSPP